MFTNLTCQLNNPNITGRTTMIRLCQLQSTLNLPDCPLIFWPFTSASVFHDLIADLLSVLSNFCLLFNCHPRWSNKISEGFTHLTAVLPHNIYLKALPYKKFVYRINTILYSEKIYNIY